ncbi:MAG: hypothetical protein AAGF48_16045 [Pseudomonadota bacterium]
MQLTYDFDLFSLIPNTVQAEFQSEFNELGISAIMSEQVALFRDERTAAALKCADETVRQLFRDAGFGLNVYSSGAPPGRYFERDELGRTQRLTKLMSLTMERRDALKAVKWGDFSYGDFLEYNAAVEPIDEVEVNALLVAAHKKHRRRKRRIKVGFFCGIGLIAYSASNLIN